ncbi:VOC family protein [Streptomyces sp. SID13031]|uniref:VOC family protein n=1 Tax=Streptomyces sp. SID13031 TaxID=2706046 RepID=UPI0013CACF1C|nr:VOC family protein [Streptomyces sp. SID13031]NEA32030.1 VOC family protein [Streptomyces sp. SID13031]
MTTSWTMTIDCADPARVARFWSTALGYVEADPPTGWSTWENWLVDHGVPEDEWGDGASLADPSGVLPSITFMKVPEARTAKNRLHLDLQVSGGRDKPAEVRESAIRQEVARLIDAGATVVHEVAQNGVLDHFWMADPEGNDFCVV